LRAALIWMSYGAFLESKIKNKTGKDEKYKV